MNVCSNQPSVNGIITSSRRLVTLHRPELSISHRMPEFGKHCWIRLIAHAELILLRCTGSMTCFEGGLVDVMKGRSANISR